ncbi:MAG: DinB family protein [Chitinophagaceae bacterium]|nr:DinB family protein [Chitinophagaceae bacterium]
MRETDRIAALFRAFYEGECWIGLNFKGVIQGITAEMAAHKTCPEANSICQLVNHLIYWRKTVIIRLQGVLGHPPMNDFYQPNQLDATSWNEILIHFEEIQEVLLQAITDFDERGLDKASPMKGQSYYQLITGCLQHDAYHMGQIVLLKKQWA